MVFRLIAVAIAHGGGISSDNTGGLDWKIDTDQTCSCPRDMSLPASWGRNFVPIRTPRTSQHYRIMGFKGGT